MKRGEEEEETQEEEEMQEEEETQDEEERCDVTMTTRGKTRRRALLFSLFCLFFVMTLHVPRHNPKEG